MLFLRLERLLQRLALIALEQPRVLHRIEPVNITFKVLPPKRIGFVERRARENLQRRLRKIPVAGMACPFKSLDDVLFRKPIEDLHK